jgi:hypothetical protein
MKEVVFFLAGIFVAYTYPEIGQFLFSWTNVAIDFILTFINNYQK